MSVRSPRCILGRRKRRSPARRHPIPQAAHRADYARAKAACDAALLAMHRDTGLDLVILRPGVVVGEGSSPFHSGLGLFNNEQHCIGWNAGRNPLPFVLAEDVADAILRACRRRGHRRAVLQSGGRCALVCAGLHRGAGDGAGATVAVPSAVGDPALAGGMREMGDQAGDRTLRSRRRAGMISSRAGWWQPSIARMPGRRWIGTRWRMWRCSERGPSKCTGRRADEAPGMRTSSGA